MVRKFHLEVDVSRFDDRLPSGGNIGKKVRDVHGLRLNGEVSLVGACEDEQRIRQLAEANNLSLQNRQTFVVLSRAARSVQGSICDSAHDRQRGTQLVRGVGGEVHQTRVEAAELGRLGSERIDSLTELGTQLLVLSELHRGLVGPLPLDVEQLSMEFRYACALSVAAQ